MLSSSSSPGTAEAAAVTMPIGSRSSAAGEEPHARGVEWGSSHVGHLHAANTFQIESPPESLDIRLSGGARRPAADFESNVA